MKTNQTRWREGLGLLGLFSVFTATVALSTPASAHTPEVTHTCDSVTASLTSYETDNSIQFILDGQLEDSSFFDGSFSKTWPIDGSISHTYQVVIDASGTAYDRFISGTTEACPVTEEPTPTPTTEAPTPSPSSSTGIGTPGYPEDVYVPEGPGPEETAEPAPLPPDSPQGSEGLAVTGGELTAIWLGGGALAVGATLLLVARLRKRA